MVAFAGAVSLRGHPVPDRWAESIVEIVGRRAPHRRAHLRRTQNAVFAHAEIPVAAPEGVLFAASCRLDDHADLAGSSDLRRSDDRDVIRRTFEARGDAGIASLIGVFAFAHWDERTATLTLARDVTGDRSLFYHVGDGVVAFASDLASLLAMPEVPRALDERMLANFLALNHRESETTFYRGVLRVPSRNVVRISAAATARTIYWSPRFDRASGCTRPEDYVAHARELFDRAVARALRDTPRAAIMLSGGFDSSAVAATAARLATAEITGYTGVPPADFGQPAPPDTYLDERAKVEALGRLYPALKTVFIAPRGAHARQSDPARYFPAVPLPRRNLCNLGWFAQIDDAIAAESQSVVLTGGRGNMTVSWDGRASLAFLLRQGRILRLLAQGQAVARGANRSLPRVLAGEAVVPLLPAAARHAIARMRGQTVADVSGHSLLRRDVVDALDLPRQWREDGFDPSYATVGGGSAALRAHMIFDQSQFGRDLAAMRYELDGVAFRDPYCDRELAEFCLSVPEDLYRRNGVSRWFARQVFADRLPREILDEERRGAQAPNWFESLDARKSIIAAEVERLESSPLASRLIDLPRLRRLIAAWPQDAGAAEAHVNEYRYGLDRAVHVGQFIRWVEGGNA